MFCELVDCEINKILSPWVVAIPLILSGKLVKSLKLVWATPATLIVYSDPILFQNNGVFKADAPKLYADESSGKLRS